MDATIATLTGSIGMEEVQSFITLFLEDSGGHMAEIDAAEERGDMAMIAREAHNFVSIAAMWAPCA